MDREGVGMQRATGPAGEFLEIDIEHRFEAARVDGALAHAAGRVGLKIADIYKPILDPMIGAPLPVSGDIGEERQCGDNRIRRRFGFFSLSLSASLSLSSAGYAVVANRPNSTASAAVTRGRVRSGM